VSDGMESGRNYSGRSGARRLWWARVGGDFEQWGLPGSPGRWCTWRSRVASAAVRLGVWSDVARVAHLSSRFTSALRRRERCAKTDRTEARWPRQLLCEGFAGRRRHRAGCEALMAPRVGADDPAAQKLARDRHAVGAGLCADVGGVCNACGHVPSR
jgi:hypothetical protein